LSEETTVQAEPKKIGSYLVCSPGTLRNAVKKQGQLLKTGQKVKRIGEILVENGAISSEDLDNAIRKQRIDRLRNSPVFASLSNLELAAISSRFTEISVPIRGGRIQVLHGAKTCLILLILSLLSWEKRLTAILPTNSAEEPLNLIREND